MREKKKKNGIINLNYREIYDLVEGPGAGRGQDTHEKRQKHYMWGSSVGAVL